MTEFLVMGSDAAAIRSLLQTRITEATKAARSDGEPKQIKCCLGKPRCLAADLVPFPKLSLPAYCGACDVWKVVPSGIVAKVESPAAPTQEAMAL